MEHEAFTHETNETNYTSGERIFDEIPDIVIVADEDTPDDSRQAGAQEVSAVAMAAEVTKPTDVGTEVAKATATETVRIEAVAKIKTAEDTQSVINSPRGANVIAAARRGETQTLTVTRDDAGQPVRFEASPSLVPPRATVSKQAAAETAPANEEPPKFVAWARIVAEHRPPPSTDQGNEDKEKPSALDIEGLLPEVQGPFQIKIVAEGVPEDVHRDIMGDVADAVHDAKQTTSGKHQAAKLEEFQARLSDAMDSALVRRTVVVGVQNPADLASLSQAVANAGFQEGQVTWRPEVDDRGRVIQYDSAESALTAGESDAEGFISAEQFSEEVRYPTTSIPGYGIKPHETFATNREIPEGAESISVGQMLDNDGNPAGELRITEKDLKRHGIIAASSGAGKTFLIRSIVTGAVKASYERSLQGEGTPGSERAVVVVDFEKIGNYAGKLADQLAGAGIPQDRATVHRISPGADGVRANINLLRLNGSTPSEQISIAVKALASDMQDPQATRVFEKFASMAMERAYTKLGWNMTTDKSRYQHGTPPTPDMEQVAIAIEEVMSETTFKSDTKGDLGSFTETSLRQALRGVPGQLFQGGYDIDWGKVIQNKGVTVIELGRISDLNARRVAMTGIFRGLTGALKVANPDGGDTDDTKVLLIMDETGGIFNGDTESGRDNAHKFTSVRGLGMAAIIAQQGDLGSLDTDVSDNTGNLWSMQMNSPQDRQISAERMGIEPPKYLANVSEGKGLYHGRDMEEGPVRFTTPEPSSIPTAPGNVENAEALIDKGTDPEFFSGEVKVLAGDLLKNENVGALVRGWVELNTALTLTGRETAKVAGDLKTQLQSMSGHDATVRDCAITMAVSSAVDSRPEIMKAMDPAGLKDFLLKEALAQVKNETPPQKEPFQYVLNEGYYSPVKDLLIDATTARRLEDSGKYEKAFFGEDSTRRVGGATAEEQLDNLKNLEEASLKTVAQTLKTITEARGELIKLSGATTEQQLKNLLDPDNATAHVEIVQKSLANMSTTQNELEKIIGTSSSVDILDDLSAKVARSLARPLLPHEQETLAILASNLDGREPADRTLGYSDMRKALTEKIEAHKLVPALDLTGMEELYKDRFDGSGEGPAQLAQQQLKAVEEKERALLAKSPNKITISNILFAPDLLKGGQTLDNVVATFVADGQEKGAIYDAFRRATNKGQLTSYTLVDMLERSDPKATQWGEQLGKKLLLGRQITMPITSSRFLVRWFAGHITKLTAMANDRQAKGKTA